MLQLLLLRPFLWGASAGKHPQAISQAYFMPSSGLHAPTGLMDQESEKYTRKNTQTHRAQPFQHTKIRPGRDTKNLAHHVQTCSQRKP